MGTGGRVLLGIPAQLEPPPQGLALGPTGVSEVLVVTGEVADGVVEDEAPLGLVLGFAVGALPAAPRLVR